MVTKKHLIDVSYIIIIINTHNISQCIDNGKSNEYLQKNYKSYRLCNVDFQQSTDQTLTVFEKGWIAYFTELGPWVVFVIYL